MHFKISRYGQTKLAVFAGKISAEISFAHRATCASDYGLAGSPQNLQYDRKDLR